jgi:hypothetical protein
LEPKSIDFEEVGTANTWYLEVAKLCDGGPADSTPTLSAPALCWPVKVTGSVGSRNVKIREALQEFCNITVHPERVFLRDIFAQQHAVVGVFVLSKSHVNL